MVIGTTLPIVGRAIDWLIRLIGMSEEMARAWVVHNVEESGETEKLVPALFAASRTKGATD